MMPSLRKIIEMHGREFEKDYRPIHCDEYYLLNKDHCRTKENKYTLIKVDGNEKMVPIIEVDDI